MIATLGEVKAYLGISGTTDDTFITQQMAVITEAIETYCRRRFKLQTYIQTFPQYDRRKLGKQIELYYYPVKEIDTLTYDGVSWGVGTYLLNKISGQLTFKENYGGYGDGDLVVQFKAGYDTVPATVMYVLCSLIQEKLNRKSAGIDLNFGSDVQSMSIPGTFSVAFDYSLTNNDRSTPFGQILGSYLNTLDPYRSEVAVVPGTTIVPYVEEVP